MGAAQHRRSRNAGPIDPRQRSANIVIATPNLVAWFKADAITGLSDGDEVDTWPDSSGLGNDATGTSTAPTWQTGEMNGLPVVRANGSSAWFTVTGLGSFFAGSEGTIVMAMRENGDGLSGVWDFNGGGFDSIWRFTGSDGYWGVLRSARIDNTPSSVPNTGSHVYSVRSKSGDGWEARREGSSIATGSHAWGMKSHPRFFVEGNVDRTWTGDIAELCIYNRRLSDVEVHAIELALGAKWGVSVA